MEVPNPSLYAIAFTSFSIRFFAYINHICKAYSTGVLGIFSFISLNFLIQYSLKQILREQCMGPSKLEKSKLRQYLT